MAAEKRQHVRYRHTDSQYVLTVLSTRPGSTHGYSSSVRDGVRARTDMRRTCASAPSDTLPQVAPVIPDVAIAANRPRSAVSSNELTHLSVPTTEQPEPCAVYSCGTWDRAQGAMLARNRARRYEGRGPWLRGAGVEFRCDEVMIMQCGNDAIMTTQPPHPLRSPLRPASTLRRRVESWTQKGAR